MTHLIVICGGTTARSVLAKVPLPTGSDSSSLVSVDTNNSIEGRLLALLKYLNTHRPDEGWNQFYNDDQVLWSQVYLSGHSQGSGHAAFQAKRKLLGRVVLYSGTSDYHAQASSYPTWMSQTSMTPAANWFGFIHAADPIANFSGDMNQVTDAWATPLGITGALTSVDSGPGSPAYGGSHRLYTSACASGSDFVKHICTLANGYQNVWDYLNFP